MRLAVAVARAEMKRGMRVVPAADRVERSAEPDCNRHLDRVDLAMRVAIMADRQVVQQLRVVAERLHRALG